MESCKHARTLFRHPEVLPRPLEPGEPRRATAPAVHSAISCIGALLAYITALLATLPAHAADDDFAYGRRLYLDKAQCSYCHGWAADGAGEPQSNGGAANLRDTRMNRDQLIEVILCGRPATPMPHFDEQAYTDQRCYGLSEAELGPKTPSLPPGATLQ